MNFNRTLIVGTLVFACGASVAAARENITIVGSSTVYPFSTVVAERFGRNTEFKTPIVESTGTGGGMKLFCAGIGADTPDVTNASRRIKSGELEMCQNNGVTDIVEVLIGYDGIAVANSINAPQLTLSLKDLFLALAKDVPDPSGSDNMVPNPYQTWKDVNASLPATKIEVLGPPPTSGTRDAFVELAMEGGCKSYDFIKSMKKSDSKQYKAVCHTLREDGAYIEAGENDNLIVQKLDANPNALGIFGFSFLDQNDDKVRSSIVEGVTAKFDSIADGSYPISRPLYFYVKAHHFGVIQGLEGFVDEFTAENTWSEDGYLADIGLIPLSTEKRAEIASAVAKRLPLRSL
ncbi:MAG: substrate-binding domain-containing protein [Gammaproteobacteria bacterium]|nr:substrate-binding domain-containing protein [Gammaproteobacteria bacterium]